MKVVLSGGTVNNVSVDSGGYLIVLPGGAANAVSGNCISTGLLILRCLGLFVLPPSDYLGSPGLPVVSAGEIEYVLAQAPNRPKPLSAQELNMFFQVEQLVAPFWTAVGTVYFRWRYCRRTNGSWGNGSQTILSGAVASNTTLSGSGVQEQICLFGWKRGQRCCVFRWRRSYKRWHWLMVA